MCAQVHPVVKIHLTRNDTILDERLCTLLHLVEETGSIQDSCQKMGISLPAGWHLLAQAEDALGFPLLRHHQERSVLTEKGKRLLQACDAFRAAVQARADMLFDSLLPL